MAMKKCKECGADISSSAKVCPKCGKKLKGSISRIIIGIIIVFIGIGIIASSSPETVNTSNEIKSAISQEKFTLLSDKMTQDSIGSTYIEGEIKNNTNKQYSYVQVTFNLYDSKGNQLGTALANINNLDPNATWKYKAIGLTTEKVTSYKLVEITGW